MERVEPIIMQSCCICGNVIRDSGTKIIREAPQYVVCKSCVRPLKTLMDPEAASERFENAMGNLKERAMETLEPEVKALLIQRFQTAREIIAQREAEHLNRLDYAKKILEEYRNNRFLMTTGFEFQGYRILQYHKVVCAEVVLGTGFFSEYLAGWSDTMGEKSGAFSNKMREAREEVMADLVKECGILGGNGIIGIAFNYAMFANNMIGVVASGTAVTVEKA